MSKDKIISLSKKQNNGTLQSPEQALHAALDEIGKRGAFENGKKLLILALDNGEDNDQYRVSFVQAGMKMSECLTLCEVAKTIFLTDMNYIPEE